MRVENENGKSGCLVVVIWRGRKRRVEFEDEGKRLRVKGNVKDLMGSRDKTLLQKKKKKKQVLLAPFLQSETFCNQTAKRCAILDISKITLWI